ncbi:MAG: 16S rRNA (uracil(1498)-N(3))-methyltransferase [Flavobacteriales bacterium]
MSNFEFHFLYLLLHLSFTAKLTEGSVTLSTEESLHVSKVLRLKNGDQLKLTDGKGKSAVGRITAAAKKNVTVQVDIVKTEAENPYLLELAIAPTKSNDRFELVLEKCTELGIARIHPILTYHSERRKLNMERSRKIVLSAMKQSQKTWLPEIMDPCKFSDFLTKPFEGNRFLAHCNSDFSRASLKTELTERATLICIGPEGDFSSEEIQQALDSGCTSVHLGEERLRTETAALFATSIFHTITTL